jgi:hypothetical protein
LLAYLGEKYGRPVGAEDVFAYVAAVAAHPGYVERFREDLVQPGLRIPLTAEGKLFFEAAEVGRRVVWLHTFGERFADAKRGRPAGPPRLPKGRAPQMPKAGAIPAGTMPDVMEYDEARRRLRVGEGYVEPVPPEVWRYEVSGKQVLRQWFSYRKADRERPIMGDRRPPSKLGEIQPDHWIAEYTTELLNVLNVLGLLVEMEPAQAELLERVCVGETVTVGELNEAGALAVPEAAKKTGRGERDRRQKKLI